MNPIKSIFDLFENESSSRVSSYEEKESKYENINEIDNKLMENSINYFKEKLIEEDYFQEGSENNSPNLSFVSEKKINNLKEKKYNSIYKKPDFIKLSCCGKGSYGQVFKIKNTETNNIFALKEINKSKLLKENKYYQIKIENDMMKLCSHPNIAKYYGYFENKANFSIIEEYCPYGDLSTFLSENKFQLTTEEIQYIIAQIIICLEYLSTKNIIHRDIKPENFLITKNFELKLIDFATATFLGKIYDEESNQFIDDNFQQQTLLPKESFAIYNHNFNQSFYQMNDPSNSFCKTNINNLSLFDINENSSNDMLKQKFVGTAEYMAPEIINSQKIGYYTDMWSLMCILFLCYTGHTPFKDKTEYLIFQNILQIKFNDDNINIIPDDARDLLLKFFKKEPHKRKGFVSDTEFNFKEIKSHPFFILKNDDITLDEIIQKLIDKCSKYKKNVVIKDDDQNNENNIKVSIDINSKEVIKNEESKDEEENDRILKCGLLKKQSPYYYYDLRKLILYDTPKINYIDPRHSIVKGTINLNKNCSAKLIKSNKFKLITPKRTFVFMCKEKYHISPWVIAINYAIEKFGQ